MEKTVWSCSVTSAVLCYVCVYLTTLSVDTFRQIRTAKDKSKVTPEQDMKAQKKGVKVYLYSSFNLSARTRRVVRATPPPLYSGNKQVFFVQGAGWAPGPGWTGAYFSSPRGSYPGPSSP